MRGISNLTIRFNGPTIQRIPIMSDIIYPRSPRETMDGWHYLPRYLDKIRLHLAGKLHADYQENLGKAFDGFWLKAAGLTHEPFVAVVKNSLTDGQVCDWVRQNVKRTPAEKDAHWQDVLNRPLANDPTAVARLQMRKEQAGLGHQPGFLGRDRVSRRASGSAGPGH